MLMLSQESTNPEDYRTNIVPVSYAMTDAQLLATIPQQTPNIKQCCPDVRFNQSDKHPACDNAQPWAVVPSYIFDPLMPDRFRCSDGVEFFPNNPKFPELYTDSLEGPDGRYHNISVYIDEGGYEIRGQYLPEGMTGRKYYLTGMLATAQNGWAAT